MPLEQDGVRERNGDLANYRVAVGPLEGQGWEWKRPTLSKRCISSFKAVGLGLFTFELSVWGKQMAKKVSFANRICLHIRLSVRQQMRYM